MHTVNNFEIIFILNFRRVLSVVLFLLGNSPRLIFMYRRLGTLSSIFTGGVNLHRL